MLASTIGQYKAVCFPLKKRNIYDLNLLGNLRLLVKSISIMRMVLETSLQMSCDDSRFKRGNSIINDIALSNLKVILMPYVGDHSFIIYSEALFY